MVPQRLSKQLRIGDVHPSGNEGRPDEPFRQPRLVGGDFAGRKMREINAVLSPRLPARQGRREFSLALIEFETAVLAQHRARARALHECQPLGLRKRHQAGLCLEGGIVATRRTRPPEPPQPRRQLRQIGRRNCERAEGIGQPFRQVPHHALLDQRKHVGYSDRRGVARTRLLADARPVDNEHAAARLRQIGGGRDADDPGADDGDLGLGSLGHRNLSCLDQNAGSAGRLAMAARTTASAWVRLSPESGMRGMRTRSLVPISSTSASLMFWTR